MCKIKDDASLEKMRHELKMTQLKRERELLELERKHELVSKLVSNKFDITTLIPFESRVLVRDNDYDEWRGAFWGHLRQKADIKYDTLRGVYRQCIPYNDDTKHLLGKTNSCDDYYKTWEK